jgi:hypothetical protein
MAAEERVRDKEAARMKEQQEEERVIADQGACDKEATKSEIRRVEGRSALWLASIAVLAFLSFKDVINSNRLFLLHLTCPHLMRCRWCCGCSSPNQLLGISPAVLDSDLDENFSKAGMMEGIVFVTLRPVAKRFDRGNYLCNLDRRFLLDQCQGVLLPEQEKITDTNDIPSRPRRSVAVLTSGVPGHT